MKAAEAEHDATVVLPPQGAKERLSFVLDFAWRLLLRRIMSGRVKVNKESSLQLHYAAVIQQMGELLCLEPTETFSIELESACGKKNIDIICTLGGIRAAIELKCFRKDSNRATDIDMCHVLRDLERLCGFSDFQIRRFACLTDNPYYAEGKHSGHADSVSIRHGRVYAAGTRIKPSWAGKWKDTSNDHGVMPRRM